MDRKKFDECKSILTEIEITKKELTSLKKLDWDNLSKITISDVFGETQNIRISRPDILLIVEKLQNKILFLESEFERL